MYSRERCRKQAYVTIRMNSLAPVVEYSNLRGEKWRESENERRVSQFDSWWKEICSATDWNGQKDYY